MEHKMILLVEDEKLHRLSLQDNLGGAGFKVICAETGQQALDLLTQQLFTVALVDIRLPDISGLELFYELKNRQPECSVILMTGQSSVEAAVAAMRDGVYDYLAKPFKIDLLLLRVERAFQLQALRDQIAASRETDWFSSHSPKFQKLMQSCRVAAATQATVLLLGESGVGKERLAEFIHNTSPRAEAPLIRVNCGASPETLLESELFGYGKGAFTGAQRSHDGLMLQAEGGTLFLDEIGEISQAMQIKLLRVLQERKLRRLGDEAELAVDFRLVAATHQNPEELVRLGRMREDFYYRLNVIPLQVPPLRERREDIPLLIVDILHHFSDQYGIAPIVFSPEALRALGDYPYPGNIRELRNLIERLLVLYAGQSIGLAELPEEIAGRRRAGSELIQSFQTHLPLRQAVKEFELRFIRTVIEEEQGNQTAAALRLGISRKNLWEKLSRN
jgi:DNA-binding NtrC family response regulator